MFKCVSFFKASFRFELIIFTFSILASGSIHAGNIGKGKEKETELCQNVRKQIQAGDIVFISSESEIFENVAKSTLSWTSHVGLALPDSKNQELMIYESTLPLSKKTSICDFVKRTSQDQIAVMRPKFKLDQSSIQRLQRTAENKMGIIYHTGFDYDTKTRLYCSKFVYDVYLNAMGIEIGYIETFADLIEKNPDPELIEFWQGWFFGKIPEKRRVVTPAGQLHDNDLELVFTTVEDFLR